MPPCASSPFAAVTFRTDAGVLFEGRPSGTTADVPIMTHAVDTGDGVLLWDTGINERCLSDLGGYLGPMMAQAFEAVGTPDTLAASRAYVVNPAPTGAMNADCTSLSDISSGSTCWPEGTLEQRRREAERDLVHLQVVVPDGHPDGHVQRHRWRARRAPAAATTDSADSAALGDGSSHIGWSASPTCRTSAPAVGRGSAGLARPRRRGPRPASPRSSARWSTSSVEPCLGGLRPHVADPCLVDHQAEADVASAGVEVEAREALARLGQPAVDLVAPWHDQRMFSAVTIVVSPHTASTPSVVPVT